MKRIVSMLAASILLTGTLAIGYHYGGKSKEKELTATLKLALADADVKASDLTVKNEMLEHQLKSIIQSIRDREDMLRRLQSMYLEQDARLQSSAGVARSVLRKVPLSDFLKILLDRIFSGEQEGKVGRRDGRDQNNNRGGDR